jgi:hypothetical protein
LMNNSLNSGIGTMKAKVLRKIYLILMVDNFCKISMFMLGVVWGRYRNSELLFFIISYVKFLCWQMKLKLSRAYLDQDCQENQE